MSNNRRGSSNRNRNRSNRNDDDDDDMPRMFADGGPGGGGMGGGFPIAELFAGIGGGGGGGGLFPMFMGGGPGGGGPQQQQQQQQGPKPLKCPVCSVEHAYKPASTSIPRMEDRCSHDCRQVYTSYHCPICWEDCEPPVVAMPCGHLVCPTDFQKLGGRVSHEAMKSPDKVAREESEERRREFQQEMNQIFGDGEATGGPIQVEHLMNMMGAPGGPGGLMNMLHQLSQAGGGGGRDDDDDDGGYGFGRDYGDSDDDDDDDDEDMPELIEQNESIYAGGRNNNNNRNSSSRSAASSNNRNSNNRNSANNRNSRNAAAARRRAAQNAADSSDDDDDEPPPLLERTHTRAGADSSSEDSSRGRGGGDDELPDLIPGRSTTTNNNASDDDSSDDEGDDHESMPDLMQGREGRGGAWSSSSDGSDNSDAGGSDDDEPPPLLRSQGHQSDENEDSSAADDDDDESDVPDLMPRRPADVHGDDDDDEYDDSDDDVPALTTGRHQDAASSDEDDDDDMPPPLQRQRQAHSSRSSRARASASNNDRYADSSDSEDSAAFGHVSQSSYRSAAAAAAAAQQQQAAASSSRASRTPPRAAAARSAPPVQSPISRASTASSQDSSAARKEKRQKLHNKERNKLKRYKPGQLKAKLRELGVTIQDNVAYEKHELVDKLAKEMVKKQLGADIWVDSDEEEEEEVVVIVDPFEGMPPLVPQRDPPRHGMWVLSPSEEEKDVSILSYVFCMDKSEQEFVCESAEADLKPAAASTTTSPSSAAQRKQQQSQPQQQQMVVQSREYGKFPAESTLFPRMDSGTMVYAPPPPQQQQPGAWEVFLVKEYDCCIKMYDFRERALHMVSDGRDGIWSLARDIDDKLSLVHANIRNPKDGVVIKANVPESSKLILTNTGIDEYGHTAVWLCVSTERSSASTLQPGLWFVSEQEESRRVYSGFDVKESHIIPDGNLQGVWTLEADPESGTSGKVVLSHFAQSGERQRKELYVEMSSIQTIVSGPKVMQEGDLSLDEENEDAKQQNSVRTRGIYMHYRASDGRWKIGKATLDKDMVEDVCDCPRNSLIVACESGNGIWVWKKVGKSSERSLLFLDTTRPNSKLVECLADDGATARRFGPGSSIAQAGNSGVKSG